MTQIDAEPPVVNVRFSVGRMGSQVSVIRYPGSFIF